MEEMLRRKAAQKFVLDEHGQLRERLTPQAILQLWCPKDGTRASMLQQRALGLLLRRAIREKALVVNVEEKSEERQAPQAGWAVPFGATFDSEIEEIRTRTAPRVIRWSIEWIDRTDFQAWLVSEQAWPLDETCLLRFWWPEHDWSDSSSKPNRQPSGKSLLDEVEQLEREGLSGRKAMAQVAATHGVTISKIKSARYDPKRAEKQTANLMAGNGRKKPLLRPH